ncbi:MULTISPECIES: hypothetical protein [unclassified Pseudomonas]|uniref:hypothetical protein n=1 Tax=unclassified Pseudomonas TaxID=196821 RepID=UPI00387AF0B6
MTEKNVGNAEDVYDGNRIYSKLVTSKKDFVGMIAYAIYKKEKLKVSEAGQDVRAFVKLKNSSTERKRYKDEAGAMMEGLLQLTIQDQKKHIEKQISEDLASFMAGKRKGKLSRFLSWHNSGAGGLIGNIYTVLVSVILVYSFASEEGWNAAKSSAIEAFTKMLG